ncbi:hypothetical protein C8R43DRAFT_1137924 [Mycena crocata]|nr:hypothetical protein C8R43DRAFT_1137924 [Mycena crocata]
MPTKPTTKNVPEYNGVPTSYGYMVGASAMLFSSPPNIKALRLEVPDLGKEFCDTEFIGTDPEGALFYNDVREFDSTLAVYYKVYHIVDGAKNYCQIKLSHNEFKAGHPDPACHAEFWANDPNNTVVAAGMNGYTHTGKWQALNISSVTTEFKKYGDMSFVSVEANSIHKEGTITLPTGLMGGVTFVVRGNLYFKNSLAISLGKHANYNNDRVVFYSKDWAAKDFTAYFIHPTGGLEVDVKNGGAEPSDNRLAEEIK